jgi:uncharacterized Zn finger protein
MSSCSPNWRTGQPGEVFAVDVTVATSRCVTCGRTDPVAALHVYARAPGLVARCPGCGAVVMRLVRTPDGISPDLRGCVTLRIPLPH